MKQVNRRSGGMTVREVVAELGAQANPANVAGMARYGINPENTLGVSIPRLRAMAKRIRTIDSRSARWIAADALRELESGAVRERLSKK